MSDASVTTEVEQERELKMTLTDGFSRALLIEQLATIGAVSEMGSVDQTDTYMDTRSRSLARAGLAARHRIKQGKRALQLKPELLIPELVFERPELKRPLGRAAEAGPELRKMVEETLPVRLRGIPAPEVVLRSRRERMRVVADGCEAELCLDDVRVFAPGTRRVAGAFAELELELASGSAAVFDQLAERLVERVPGLEASNKSKHRRALEILEIPPHKFGAPSPAFEPLTAVDDVARAIGSAQLRAMLSYEAGTRVGLDPEQLHKMRVATRRLRAALQTFAGCFDQRRLTRLLDDFKWLAAVLGEVRDLDVHLMDTVMWQRRLGPTPEAGWNELRRVLGRRWDRARERLLQALDSDRYAQLVSRARETFDHPAPRRRAGHPGLEPVVLVAERAVKRRVRQFRRGAKACRQTPSAAAVHALRIVGKKLRYTTEFFRTLYPPGFRERVARLATFQDVLGRFQDNVVAGELARALRDEAFADLDGDGAAGAQQRGVPAPYLFVLGQLLAYSDLGAAQAEAEVNRAYRALGGDKILRSLAASARRASQEAVSGISQLFDVEAEADGASRR